MSANDRPTPVRRLAETEHCIPRQLISDAALQVVSKLRTAGYDAYLVGGCVRDLMLGRKPKDFDLATNATPEQVRAVFSHSRLIGRRFRLAHVYMNRSMFEVATFRSGAHEESDEQKLGAHGRILRDNVYGTLEEDALRRDFTVNAMYYDAVDNTVIDFVNGHSDLNAGQLRLIGDPRTRYQEDPVRMLRAVRFAAKLGFKIEAATEAAISELAYLLDPISSARLYEECRKLFMTGAALKTFELLRHYRLFERLFPLTEKALAQQVDNFPLTLVGQGMNNTDVRISVDKPVTPAFLFAVLLWEPVRLLAAQLEQKNMTYPQALAAASSQVTAKQIKHIAIPKRFTLPMREIWNMQPWFHNRRGRRVSQLMQHPRFRAAYDFLLLRAQAGEADQSLADWWTQAQTLDEAGLQAAIDQVAATQGTEPKTGRLRKRKRRSKTNASATPNDS